MWFVNFVGMNFDPRGVRPLCGLKFFTLVGSVHFVDMNLNSLRGPSILWTYVGCLTLIGFVHFVDMNLDPS